MRLLDPSSLSRHTDRLYRAAWALCGSREDAEDLVQETFARVLARPRVLRGDATEIAYLMRVLRNTFLTGRRDASRRPVAAAAIEDVIAPDPRPTRAPDQALELDEIYTAIADLPEHFRLALVAVDLLGLSYREAAKALGVREETITTRLFRARRQVAQRCAAPASLPSPAVDTKGPAGPGGPPGTPSGTEGRSRPDRAGPADPPRSSQAGGASPVSAPEPAGPADPAREEGKAASGVSEGMRR